MSSLNKKKELNEKKEYVEMLSRFNLDLNMFKIIKQFIFSNWIYIIISVFILIYILHLLLRFHFVLWDEAVYIGIGKYIYSLGQVGLWEEIRPLGLPLLFGAAWKLGAKISLDATNIIITDRIIEMLFAAGTIILVYLISLKLFNRNIAAINAFIYAVTPLFFYNSFRLMTEIPSTFFVLLAVYFFIERRFVIAGTISSIAFIFRYPQGLILVCCLIALIIEFLLGRTEIKTRLKGLLINSAKYIIGFVPLVGLLLIFNKLMYGSALYPLLKASLHQGNPAYAINNILLNLFYYPFNLYIQNMFLIFGLVGLFILLRDLYVRVLTRINEYKKLRNKIYTFNKPAEFLDIIELEKKSYYNETIIIVITFIVYLAYLTFMINKQDRFGLMLLPFAAILSGYGLVYVFKYIGSLEITESITKKRSIANKKVDLAVKEKLVMQTWLKRLPYILLIIYIIFAGALSLHKDYNKFLSFPKDEPEIVKEYYKFFPDNYNGIILTSDPVHVAYADIKMIPFYFSVEEGSDIYYKWTTEPQLMPKVKAIVFIEAPFMCFDKKCEEQLRPDLFKKIKSFNSNKLVFEKQYEEMKRIYYVGETS